MVTPTRGAKKDTPASQVQEKTLRFRFPVMNGGNCVPPPVLHYHFIAAVQEAFGDQIQFLDNKNRKVGKIDLVRFDIKNQINDFTWYSSSLNQESANQDQSQSESDDPHDRRSVKYVSHRIRTTCTMADIKANPRIRSLLMDHNFFVNFHRWDETEWDVVQLGFFFGLDPTFLSVDQATSKITSEIQSAIAEKSSPRPKMPKFKLVFGSPKITIKNKTVRTKAYAIESQRSTSKELIALLKDTYKTTGSFILYQMRQRNPEALHKLIRTQTQYIAKNRVILLNYIGEGAIFYLEQHISAIPGVQNLLPTRHNEDMGQYKVSVKQKDFTHVRQYLSRNLSEWYNTHVTPDGRNQEGQFPGAPAVAPITGDKYSDDEHSYMSVSINTAMSMVSVLSDDEDTPKATTQVVPSSIKGWPPPSGVTVASSTPSTDQISALDQSFINDLASSRQEVEALKNQVSQLVAQCESQAQQIAAAVHQQVVAALAALPQGSISTQEQPPNAITQDQFTMFVQSQDSKFESMMQLFRDMMEQKSNHHPPELGQSKSNSNKRGATGNLDDMLNQDDQMEFDPKIPGSRKRNDHRKTPVKHHVQMFPLFRQDVSTSGVSRSLFPGEQPQKAQPASMPLPDSPRQEDGNLTSLTVVEDVHPVVIMSVNSSPQQETTSSSSEEQYFPEEDRTTSINLSPSPLQRLRIAQAEWSKLFLQDTSNSPRIREGNRSIPLSVDNQRENVAWGDHLEEKPDNVTRVYCFNANGFTLDRRGGKFEDFCKTANEVQADVVGCQEHNLDTTQVAVKSIL